MRLTAELYSTIVASLRAGGDDRSQDRRDDPRVGLRVRVTLIAARSSGGAGAVDVCVRDLSRSGVCIISAAPMAVGSQFIAYLPGGKADPLAVRYEVRHCTPIGAERVRIGAEFKGIVVQAAPPSSAA